MKKMCFSLKGLLLFLLLGTFCSNLNSQSIELKNVTKDGFKGLCPLDDKGYYIQFLEGMTGKGKNAKSVIHLYMMDNDLKVTSDFNIELGINEKLEDVAFNGNNFMMIISSVKEKTRTIKVLDNHGKEVAVKVNKDVPARLLSKPSAIYPLKSNDFLVINYIKEKKIGYNIERYTDKLDLKYSTEEIPDKKKLYPVDFTLSGDKLYVLEYVDADMSDYFEYHLASFDINTGALSSKKQLKSSDDKSFGFATFIQPTKDGGVATGGMYFNSSKTQEANSDGFFAAKMSSDGNLNYTYVDWKTVAETVKDKNTNTMWGGKTKTFMHDLFINEDGSFTLVGENYRKGDANLAGEKSKSGFGMASKALSVAGATDAPTETALTVSEFVLMDFDASNKFLGIRKIDKPNSVTVVKPTTDQTDQVYAGQMRGLNLANIINNNGYFPYKFVAQSTSANYLVYWQRYDPIQKELLYFTPANSTSMDSVSMDVTGAEIVYYYNKQKEMQDATMKKMGGLGKLAQKANDLNDKMATISGSYKENYFELKGSDDPNDYRARSINSRIIKGNLQDKVLIYDFIPDPTADTGSTAFGRVIKSLPGTLKIWYIDLPRK